MQDITKIGIVGAGQMGRGIAECAATFGLKVDIFDVSDAQLDAGHGFIEKRLIKGKEKGKHDESFVQEVLGRISITTEIEKLKESEVVIEAATEKKQIKFNIFKELDAILPENCLLCSNTSSISITELASQTNRPQKVMGMHFMNPVPVMKLVEGIRGLETSNETFEKVKLLAEKMQKTFVVSNDRPGFIVNRILMPMINEAIFALDHGVASVPEIDAAMKLGTNQPMGPLQLADFIGLDTCLEIMNVLYDGFADSKYRPAPMLKQMVLAGRLGKKVKKGFYDY